MNTRLDTSPQQRRRACHQLAIALLIAATLAPGVLIAAPAEGGVQEKKAPVAKRVRHKVIFQVSDADPKKWSLALNNAHNVQTELGAGNVDIEIVAYGPGISMLKAESELANRIQDEALGTGMKVVACENTMINQKLTKADMLNGIGFVRAGVVELMLRQKQGYAYIRP